MAEPKPVAPALSQASRYLGQARQLLDQPGEDIGDYELAEAQARGMLALGLLLEELVGLFKTGLGSIGTYEAGIP